MNQQDVTGRDPASLADDGAEGFTVRVANNRPADVAPPEPGAPSVGSAAAAAGGAPGTDAELDAMLAGYLDPEVLREGVSWLYDYAAKVYEEPHWSLHDAEAREIAEALSIELRGLAERAPFLGGVAGAVGGNRVRLAVAVGVPTVPRIVKHRRIQRQRRAAQAAQRPQRGAGPGPAAEPAVEPATDTNRPPIDFADAMARAQRMKEG